jgi:uncharacterized membrane protein
MIFMKNQVKTKQIVLLALFIAMSVVGGYIKLPNPITSSIAFDSLPAYLAALLLGGIPGAIVGFLGHMASAALGGFPLSLPIHILVGIEMAIIMPLFNLCAKKTNIFVVIIVGILLNGVVCPASLILVPGMGIPVFLGSLIPLTTASALNIIICALIFKPIKKAIPKEMAGVFEGGV